MAMSEKASELDYQCSDGGIAAKHPISESGAILAAPATGSEFNTIRPTIIPFACWRADDLRFEFDSSIVRPEIADEMKHLFWLVSQHPGCPLAVFGHADPVGNDDYNKTLSGRRAMVIYAMLTRD